MIIVLFPEGDGGDVFVVLQSFSSVHLCNPMDCSTSGFPVLHCLPDFAETHIHWVSDAIQPSPPPSFSYIWELFLLLSSELFWMSCLPNFFLNLPQGGILRILRTGGKKWTVERNPWCPPGLKSVKTPRFSKCIIQTSILLDCSPLYCIRSPGMESSNLWVY